MIRKQKGQNKNIEKGQTLIEYSVVLGVVVMVILGFNPLIKVSTQRMIRLVWDNVGLQQNSEQTLNDDTRAYLVNAQTNTRSIADKRKREAWGFTTYEYGDRVITSSNSFTDLGVR